MSETSKQTPRAKVVKGTLWAPISFKVATQPVLSQRTPRFWLKPNDSLGPLESFELKFCLKNKPDFVWVEVGD